MKIRKIAAIVFTVLAAGMAVMSGVMKFTRSEQVMIVLEKMGVDKYVLLLGTMEILFAILFVIPKTMRLGFILLSCYFAGALATELSRDASLNALTPLALIWIAAFLRDQEIFFPANPKPY